MRNILVALGMIALFFTVLPTPKVQAGTPDDKVWICHFPGHHVESEFYTGGDVVIGQEELNEEAAGICESLGGEPINVAREACANGHDANDVAELGTCEGE